MDLRNRRCFDFASSSNLAALRWAFVHGADARSHDANGTTLLHVAARSGSYAVVKDLILRQVDLNAVDCAGWTPLHVASCMGRQDRDMSRILCRNRCFWWFSPLKRPIRQSEDVSLYLLQMGARPCKTANGLTPENLCSNPHTKELVVGFEERRPRAASRSRRVYSISPLRTA